MKTRLATELADDQLVAEGGDEVERLVLDEHTARHFRGLTGANASDEAKKLVRAKIAAAESGIIAYQRSRQELVNDRCLTGRRAFANLSSPMYLRLEEDTVYVCLVATGAMPLFYSLPAEGFRCIGWQDGNVTTWLARRPSCPKRYLVTEAEFNAARETLG